MRHLRERVAPMVRGALRRRKIQVVLLLTALAVPAGALAGPLPAMAVTHLCETNGQFCVGAPGLADGAAVDETVTGRNLNVIDLGNNSVKIQVPASAGGVECVAASADGILVTLRRCNGADGTIWEKSPQNGHMRFESNRFTDKFLAGHNDGSQFHILALGAPNWFYNFN